MRGREQLLRARLPCGSATRVGSEIASAANAPVSAVRIPDPFADEPSQTARALRSILGTRRAY